MFEFFLIWLYVTTSGIADALVPITLVGAILYLLGHIPLWVCSDYDMSSSTRQKISNWFSSTRKPLVIWSLFVIVFASAVPSKNELAFIVGGGVALHAIQTEEVQALPTNVLNALNRFLEQVGTEEAPATENAPEK